VVAPPPLIYGAAWIAGLCLHRALPLPLLSKPRRAVRLAGGVLAGIGLTASLAVTLAFRKAATPISPLRPASRLVLAGPYRHTRNPDYLGQSLLYLGTALWSNRGWPLLLLPPALAVIHYGVVVREERYLEARFGPEYRDYESRVPRWL
jgi:protein-S-isoprenylcysteine O-methyltransferase Ste14